MDWEDEIDDTTLLNACDYIVSRAVFSADNTCVFDHTYETFLKKEDISLSTDQLYLWIIERADDDICMKYRVPNTTGIIVLELLRKDGVYPCNTLPVGVLMFLCTLNERDKILYRGWFSKLQLLQEKCRIIWFDESTIFQLSTDCEHMMNASHLLMPWENLGRYIEYTLHRKPRTHTTVTKKIKSNSLSGKKCIEVTHEVGGERCVSGDYFVLNTSILSVFTEWAQSAGILTLATNMTQIDQLWLFFHINTRSFDRKALPPDLFRSMCESINSQELINMKVINRIKFDTLLHLNCVGMNKKKTTSLMHQYTQHIEAFEQNTLAYQALSDQMSKYRKLYHNFQIYASTKIDDFTVEAIQTAPQSVFDTAATRRWISTITPLLHNTLSLDATCVNILNGASVKVVHGNLNLYAMMNDVTKAIGETYSISYSSNFKFEIKHGVLSESICNEPILFWDKESKYLLPWNSKKVTPSHARCMMSSNTRSPIWLSWPPNRTTPTHSWLIPSKVSYAKDIDSILEDLYVYDGFTHELLNPYLHVSNLILDVDIKAAHPYDEIVKQIQDIKLTFIMDICDLIQHVLTKLLSTSLKLDVIHCYVFESRRSINEEKMGFHVHVALPEGIVFANKQLCQDVVKILNNMTIKYPETLGLVKHNIFDVAIYGSSIHSLRGPYQRKPSGKEPLCCVYRTDHKPLTEKIPLNRQFLHGYHIDSKTNEKLLKGTIVTKIQGCNLLDDEIFLRELGNTKINGSIKTLCHHMIGDIMDDINNMCVVFSCAKPHSQKDIDLLQRIANNLWDKHKFKIANHMHVEGYSESDIECIVHNTMIIVNNAGLSLVDKYTLSGKFSICLMRNHRRTPSNVMYRIKYGKHMIRMLITASCFKESCHGQARVPNGSMEMMPVFLAPCIKEKVDNVWALILNSCPLIKKIIAGNDNSSDEIFQTNAVDDIKNIIGSTNRLQRLFNITKDTNNKLVLSFRSQYMIFVLFMWNESDIKCPSILYTCMDPSLFINHIKKSQVMSICLLEAISNTMKNDGCIL